MFDPELPNPRRFQQGPTGDVVPALLHIAQLLTLFQRGGTLSVGSYKLTVNPPNHG